MNDSNCAGFAFHQPLYKGGGSVMQCELGGGLSFDLLWRTITLPNHGAHRKGEYRDFSAILRACFLLNILHHGDQFTWLIALDQHAFTDSGISASVLSRKSSEKRLDLMKKTIFLHTIVIVIFFFFLIF